MFIQFSFYYLYFYLLLDYIIYFLFFKAIMFSAFKGPFESRIEEWNKKLCCMSGIPTHYILLHINYITSCPANNTVR